MTYTQLLDRIISDGAAYARTHYVTDSSALRGTIEGFEACHDKAIHEIVALHAKATCVVQEARLLAEDYWHHCCFALAMEWVLNVLSAGFTKLGYPPLLPHLPTARAALKFAEIVEAPPAVQEEALP